MASKMLQDYPDVLTARHIAAIMGVGYTKALNIIKYSEGLSFIRVGCHYRMYKPTFEKWLSLEETRVLTFD